jgi:hypothetical protein
MSATLKGSGYLYIHLTRKPPSKCSLTKTNCHIDSWEMSASYELQVARQSLDAGRYDDCWFKVPSNPGWVGGKNKRREALVKDVRALWTPKAEHFFQLLTLCLYSSESSPKTESCSSREKHEELGSIVPSHIGAWFVCSMTRYIRTSNSASVMEEVLVALSLSKPNKCSLN